MKLYNLESILEDKIGVPPPIIIDASRIDKPFYDESIGYEHFYDQTEPIYLELSKWSGSPYKFRDFHRWDAGSPDAYVIACSERFCRVLETLKLPPYRIYNSELRLSRRVYQYYVLHFIQDWEKEIDYSKSVFNVLAYLEDDRILKKLKIGEVKSYEHYNEINKQLVTKNHYLFPTKIHFPPHIYYDIWGLFGIKILSEHAKQVIENAQITGVAMPEICKIDFLSNIEIVMNNQTYYPEQQTKTLQYNFDLQPVDMVAEPEIGYDKK